MLRRAPEQSSIGAARPGESDDASGGGRILRARVGGRGGGYYVFVGKVSVYIVPPPHSPPLQLTWRPMRWLRNASSSASHIGKGGVGGGNGWE